MLRLLAAATLIALIGSMPAHAQVSLYLTPCFKGWTAGSAFGNGIATQMRSRLPSAGSAELTISVDSTVSQPELWGRRINADYTLNLRVPPASQDLLAATMARDKEASIQFSFNGAGAGMAKLHLRSWGVSGTLDKCRP